ncbi:MAG: HAMP domain-containing protein [Balneolaceae bacterium]|nr:HAMP domain-containing protein [Balneolaceae bacterium]MBO6545957.1 HAMP domain-containing protein [Balneolaceae bacterium]MBO6647353.1 HAMP domain-containing protein [Balneolaceae bacterium]
MSILKKNRTSILFGLLCLLALGYSLFEWLNFQNAPQDNEVVSLAEESVASASENFKQFVFQFTNNSTDFTNKLKTAIENNENAELYFDQAHQTYSFWGSVIFKEGKKIAWDGFVPDSLPYPSYNNDESLHISIDTENNVTFLFSLIPFFVEQQDTVVRYDVYNRVKISQVNILSIGKNLELSPERLFTNPDKYPVVFDFNEFTQPDALASSVISTVSSDSLGEIYTLHAGYEQYKAYHLETAGIFRALFLACFLILIGTLAFSFSKELDGWTGIFVQLAAFTCIWLLIKTLYPLINIQAFNIPLLANLYLVNYLVNSIYTLLICFSITSFLITKKKSKISVSPAGFVIIGIIVSASAGAIFFDFLSNTTSVIINSNIKVMDLELLPSLSTLIFYLCSSISFISLFILFIAISWFTLKSTAKYSWYYVLGLILGVATFAIISKVSFAQESNLNWIVVITTLFVFLTIVFSVYVTRKKPVFIKSSKLRSLIFVSYLAVCFVYIAYASGNTARQDLRMLEAAETFSLDEKNQIQNITVDLLLALSSELSNTPQSAFDDAFFDQFIEDFLKPDWLRYSISVQIIDSEGDRFTDYTTSLSPPQWSTAFRIAELEIPFEDEQIRRENLRPVLRRRPINTINASYSSFIRGWIPIFESSESDNRIGWILCSVYEELPQLDRPLRTVISSQQSGNWGETLLSSEYENGVAIRSMLTGIPLEIPEPSILSEQIRTIVYRDSIYTSSFSYGGGEIKELFVKKSEENIVRVASRRISVAQHTFSFLRLFFVLIILGIIVMFLFSWNPNWQIFGSSRRFKDRLIDRFILASLVCLLALVGASYFVLNQQNNEDVEDQLFNRLENLVSNLESESSSAATDPSELQRITSILDVDASLYTEAVLMNSTTSQIFTQHLLPTTIPWEVYTRILNNESNRELSIVELDNQQMMIGYQPWFDQNNQIAGIASIPTFLKAPKFYERLLSTTSYLIAFYTVIFGLLMMVVGFISSQLTSPLEEISNALKKISDGDLDIKLPVNSEDEIGTLTKAYNLMTKRLKTVQKELAETEREAAWKEMAQQIAHEIKNPLTPMKLNLQHLERQLEGTEKDLTSLKPKVAKIASNMIEQIDSLNKIASDFSKFAKPIEHEFTRIDLNDLAHSVADMYKADESFILLTDFSKKELPVLGAKEELRRVLVNLIKNAKEALDDQGKISISTFSDAKNSHAFVTVTDNGEGISLEDQDKIFVPNFSTKSSGTGLGLAITKKIIEEHDGEISFISTSGQGTSFTVRIPLSRK